MDKLSLELQNIIDKNKDKRIVVVGTTCTGKSTFIKNLNNALDMDELIFPLLTKKESEYICQKPWTEEIGKTMTKLVKEKIKIKPGFPVFGTVVIDSDLIIYLHVSDKLLMERTKKRGKRFEDAKNMQKKIELDIKSSKLPVIKFQVR